MECWVIPGHLSKDLQIRLKTFLRDPDLKTQDRRRLLMIITPVIISTVEGTGFSLYFLEKDLLKYKEWKDKKRSTYLTITKNDICTIGETWIFNGSALQIYIVSTIHRVSQNYRY
jgi:hypothetical protein